MKRLIAILLLLPAAASAKPAAGRVPTAAVMSADAGLVAAQEHMTVRVWQASTGKLLCSFESDAFFRGSIAKGALALVTEEGLEVRRGPGFAKRVKLKAPKALSVGPTSISADGSLAAALYTSDMGAGSHDRVGVYDALTGASLARLRLRAKGARVMGAALGPEGRLVAVYGDRRGKRALLEVYELKSPGKGKSKAKSKVRRILRWSSKTLETTYSAAISPDGRLLALGAGKRILLWDLKRRKLLRAADTAAAKALFPPLLRGPGVKLPGAHLLAFSADGSRLASLHAFSVVGVATWSVSSLKPTAWIARPRSAGTMRQAAWAPDGTMRLITAGYSSTVTVHAPKGRRFAPLRALTP